MRFAVHAGHLFFCETHKYLGIVDGYTSPNTEVCEAGAARVADMCSCAVAGLHESPICEGAAAVLVNGLPAARLLDPTLEPGFVFSGEPSVLIGGPTFSVADFISIEGSPEYQAKVLRHLVTISQTQSGQRLFASMRASGKRCTIKPCTADCCSQTVAHPDPELKEDMHNGKGTDTAICYDPDKQERGDATTVKQPWDVSPNYSPDVTLFHEMVHADDAAHGRLDKRKCRNTAPEEMGIKHYRKEHCGELRAMGVGPYADHDEYYSENSYREERGYRQAEWY